MAKSIMTAVDIGTSNVCTAVAEVDGQAIRLMGIGRCSSKGVRTGVVTSLNDTVECLRMSLERAEKDSGTVAESAFVSVGGAYVKGLNCEGNGVVRGRRGEVSREDILRAIEEAADFEIPENSQIIHVLKRSFCVDGQEGISNPIGMAGRELLVRVHVVLNSAPVVNNIVTAINKTGVRVEAVVMQQLASGQAVLTKDERDLGVLLLDIGGGTTDLAVYRGGSICHSESLPIAGDTISKDIAISLKTSLKEAESLKKASAGAVPDLVMDGESVTASEVGTGRRRSVPRRLLCEIARARYDEILRSVGEILDFQGFRRDRLTGVVLTGGGSLLAGACERANQILEMPVRRGLPSEIAGPGHPACSPAYATALGLIAYARDIWEAPENEGRALASLLPRIAAGRRLRGWLRRFDAGI